MQGFMQLCKEAENTECYIDAMGTTYEPGKSLPYGCASTGGNEHP